MKRDREGRFLSSVGREFHALGTEAEKERFSVDLKVVLGMTKSFSFDERRVRVGL